MTRALSTPRVSRPAMGPPVTHRQRGNAAVNVLAVAVLVAVAAASYWVLYPQHAPAVVRPYLAPLALEPEPVRTLYRWRDDGGNWQLSDRPPADDRPVEAVAYNLDANGITGDPRGDGGG
ncbi:MAG: hypothetical protein ACFCBW_04825 [Candidatus Competibacterales bacterium]